MIQHAQFLMYQKLVKISGVAMPRSVIGEENSHRALN